MENYLIAIIYFVMGFLSGALYASLPSLSLTQESKRKIEAATVMILIIVIGLLMVIISKSVADIILPNDPDGVNTLVTAMFSSAVTVAATLEIIHLRTSPDR